LARDTNSTERQRALATVWDKIGDVKQRQKELDGARRAYEEALDLRRKVTVRELENAQWRKDTSNALDRVGYILLLGEDLQGARKFFEEEVGIDRKLAEADASNMAAQRDLVWSLNRVGDLLQKTGDRPGARKYFEEVVVIDSKVAASEPNNRERYRKHTEDLTKLIKLLVEIGDVAAVRTSYEDLFRADERWAEVLRREFAGSPGAEKKTDLVQALGNASWHALLSNQPLQSARLGEEAIKLDSSQTWINVKIAHAYLFLGRIDEAKKIYSATKNIPRGSDGTRKYADEIKDDFNLFRKLQMTMSEMSRIESELGI
jgi:tetratricopeptide (TPR) repeat protein